LAANSTAGDKTYYLDAVYLTPGTTAPIGWSSGRNLMNHLDSGADHLNVLCVTEIPGEVEAETVYCLDMDDTSQYLRLAKRTRDNPHDFIWELNADTAYTTADAHYALTDAACIDSLKENDAACPVAHRITVTFAGDQTMRMRCYWDITANLASYYGKFGVVLITKRNALTDTIKVQLYENDELSNYGLLTSIEPAGTAWNVYKTFDGWETLVFRVGSSDNDLFGAGNNWRICVYASTAGGAAWDELHIAAAFLVPLDEGYLLAGGSIYAFGFGIMPSKLKNLDGDLGFFRHLTTDDSYSANIGMIGRFPQLTPKVENWFYLLTCTGTSQTYALDDTGRMSVQYRPRGIFLRGTNP
jgi:hypothetical protein